MEAAEAAALEADADFDTIIAMRRWDEAAKVAGLSVPSIESYATLIDKFSAQNPTVQFSCSCK